MVWKGFERDWKRLEYKLAVATERRESWLSAEKGIGPWLAG